MKCLSMTARCAGRIAAAWVCALVASANPDLSDRTSRDLDPAWATEHLRKTEHRIPMRDGVRLHTSIYRLKAFDGPMPIILVRTPFGSHPYGEDGFPGWLGPGAEYLEDGYILVKQDVRGTFMSEGVWQRMTPHRGGRHREDVVDESTDGYDTIDWLVDNVPGNNGRVCLWGGSFDGFYALASMIDPHPALQCAVIHAPTTDWWWDDVFHNGALQLAHVFWGFAEFGTGWTSPGAEVPEIAVAPDTRDGYAFFLNEIGGLADVNRLFFHSASPAWQELVGHPTRDAFWAARNIHPHLHSGPPAVLVAGGWYDAEDLYGSLATYRSLADSNEIRTFLVMGPWEHTQWMDGNSIRVGDVTFENAQPHDFRVTRQRPFLEFYLRGAGVVADRDGHVDLPRLSLFDTGTGQWTYPSLWPPRSANDCRLYLGEGGALAGAPPERDSSSRFVSDPARPVPYSENHYLGMDSHYMTADQRFAARRPDVLVFRTPPLEQPVTVSGPVEATLWVATDRSDADWVVKLIDVQPGNAPDWPDMRRGQRRAGYQMLVRGEIFRGRYRESLADPKPFQPGEPVRITIRLNDVQHTFLPGHRIMVQVQSTWFPLFDRNPQAWVDNIFEAVDSDFERAAHTVHHDREQPSAITLPATSGCPAQNRRPTVSQM